MSNNIIRVLIPTDFSIQSEFAYKMVQNLSKKVEMEVTFLHILNVPDTVTLQEKNQIETCGEIDIDYVQTQYDMALSKLKDIESKNEGVQTKIKLGKITANIVEFAKEGDFDFIAIGTKGITGLAEKLIGSEAQHIAKKSEVPVLTLMCDRSELKLQNILLVHNFEENQNQSLDLLKIFIKAFHTKLHFLQITKDLSEEEQIKKNMKVFAQNNNIETFEMHVLKDTNVEEGVYHFNQMHDMDMVCMGTHGKGGLLHKSATAALINHMYKPVISYKIK